MPMGGNQNHRTSDLAHRIEPVTEMLMLILALIYVTVFLLEFLPNNIVHDVLGEADSKEE